MVATPTYDQTTHYRYTESLSKAWVHCAYHGVALELEIAAGFTLVQYARNYLAQKFLNDKSLTHILWIDADLGFDPTGIMRLLAHGKDVVGGVYPVKTTPAWFPFAATGHSDGTLLEAKVLPTGFLMVSRRAMEAVAETVPTYVHRHRGEEIETKHIFDLLLVERDGKQELLGEDVVLCHRLQELGFDIWCDPDIGFRHCGMHEWRGMLRREMDRAAERIAQSSAA